MCKSSTAAEHRAENHSNVQVSEKGFLGLKHFLYTERGLDNGEAEMTESILIYFNQYSVQKSEQIDFLTSKAQLVPLADNVTY